jgi:ADP-heptose:LPS heptosyltransferase
VREVLALRALGLGDALTAVPALRSLRSAWPGRRLVLAGPADIGGWLVRLGVVDDVLDLAGLDDERAQPAQVLAVLGSVPEVVVDLHGRGPQSHRLLQRLGSPTLVAFHCPEAGHLQGPHWDPDEHEVDRWLRLIGSVGGRGRVDDLRLPSPGQRGRHIVIHPGAAHASRRWPLDRWTVVAEALTGEGHHVVVTGGPAEAALVERIAAGAPVEPIAGRLDLAALARTVGTASLLLSADTGVAHLATAFATPSVTLFGPVSPALWGARIDPDLHISLWSGGPEDPRPGDPLGDVLDERLAALGVSDVLHAASGLLARAPHTARLGEAVRQSDPTVTLSRR